MDLGAVLSGILLGPPSAPSGSAMSRRTSALDRALGAAAALGLSLAAYRLLSAAVRGVLDGGGRGGGRGGGGGGGAGKEEGGGVERGGSPSASEVSGRPTAAVRLPAFLSDLILAASSALLAAAGGPGRLRPPPKGSGADGDEYHRAAHGGGRSPPGGAGEGAEPVPLFGSCHCGSVRFTLMAPRSLTAMDCRGKIRYPHHRTTADKFELIAGAERLSVYYVTLGGDPSAADPAPPRARVAAHTFCGRCGVHVLRAPDSDSDVLEVNVNCIDGGGATATAAAAAAKDVPARVTFYSDPIAGLGAGSPAPERWSAPPPAAEDGTHASGSGGSASRFEAAVRNVFGIEGDVRHSGASSACAAAAAGWGGPGSGGPVCGASSAASLPPLRGVSKGTTPSDVTPDTSATTASDVLWGASPADGVVGGGGADDPSGDDSSMMDSIDGYSEAVGGGSAVVGVGAGMARTRPAGAGAGGGDWSVASSLRPARAAGAPSASSSVVSTDQLKYYMRRHLASSSVSDISRDG